MFTSIILVLIAFALLAYLWDDINREEASERYRREVAEIMDRKERTSITVVRKKCGHDNRRCM